MILGSKVMAIWYWHYPSGLIYYDLHGLKIVLPQIVHHIPNLLFGSGLHNKPILFFRLSCRFNTPIYSPSMGASSANLYILFCFINISKLWSHYLTGPLNHLYSWLTDHSLPLFSFLFSLLDICVSHPHTQSPKSLTINAAAGGLIPGYFFGREMPRHLCYKQSGIIHF